MSDDTRLASTSPLVVEFPLDLQQLVSAIDTLPEPHAAKLGPLLDRVVESTRRRRRILDLVQEALSQLRLDMKYLMFDLEATRRERDDFRAKLKELREFEEEEE